MELPNVICPKCQCSSELSKWNSYTEEYASKNSKNGSYGGNWSTDSAVICPKCDRLIDTYDMKNAEYED